MINQVNKNGAIGIKKLSDADLGLSIRSNQTHIGLFDGTLDFLDMEHQIISSQLIHNGKVVELLSLLDYITREDGSLNAPKIRKGAASELMFNGSKINSVVREIRSIVNTTQDWFLLWFGLDNNELVFHLFNNDSEDYLDIQNIIKRDIGVRRQIASDDRGFIPLIRYLDKKIKDLNIEYYEELEISSQIGEGVIERRVVPRKIDIEKANKMFKETGQKGEEILNEYLELQKFNSFIKEFKWMNKSSETGMPYDFEITDNDNFLTYSDAKATRYKFEQPIVLSSGELKFINENKNNYLIHRMYSVFDQPKLRICNNIYAVSDAFMPEYKAFRSSLKNKELRLQNLSLSVPTSLESLDFTKEISLNY
jgi:hypothetical protein